MSGRYVDFAVGIESAAGGGYRVRAFSPDAEAESITRLEFDPDRLHAALRSRMSSALPKSRARDLAGSAGSMGGVGGVGSVGSAGAATAGLDLTEVGRGLFAALFTDEVGELYSAAWSAALAANQGLRIRLHLRPRNPELAWLTRLPWELLYDERAGGFPCLNPLNPMVRHLDLPRPVERAAFQLPLRVLVVAANPAGLSALDLQGEQEAMAASRQVRVEVLAGPGPEDLRRELLRGRYQVVHFMGHGLSDADQGSLVFATPGGQPRLVTGSALSQLIQGAPAPGLTVLNACQSAVVPRGSGADPLAGVAGALVRGGQAAVVGMQLPIPDRAALTFSKHLYARLAAGDLLEAAVAEARLALYLADARASDWVAPVLFLRGSDRRIEDGERKEKRPERDQNRVDFAAKVIQGGEVAVTGEVLSGRQDGAAGRPRDSRTRVKTELVDVRKLIVIGTDHRDRGES
ncbi:MAG TPA: CHAT domain-containing protein [Thermoanaerobaculia bacterium]|nr:CHAT domain-containing protein [Thermoanaerobaculia bacterium]